MQELLPLSWRRIDGIRPLYRSVTLPLSGIRWISLADIPHQFSLQILYEDLVKTFPEGFVLRGCPPSMSRFFLEMNCGYLRTGAEAVLDLKKPHLKRKTVASSLSRGKKQGYTEELVPNEVHLNMLDAFRKQTRHADKPQLLNLFRDEPDSASRLFVFRNFGGNWLAAMSLSGRGRNEMHTELILRHKNAPGDIMESLVAGIFIILESEGFHEWSLGEVPFIFRDEIRAPSPDSLETLMLSFAANSRYAYDHESLFRFKNKFAPEWRTVALCSNISPSALMLGELAVSMGYGHLLVHETFSVLKKILMPL